MDVVCRKDSSDSGCVLDISERDGVHVFVEDKNLGEKELSGSNSDISIIGKANFSQNTPNSSPATMSEPVGKRKRVQHNYARLSRGGYVDDYLGRERRFSNTSESEPNESPTPPKSKVAKTKNSINDEGRPYWYCNNIINNLKSN